jgi:hypothetical protein
VPAIGGFQSETGCFSASSGFLRCRTGLISLQGRTSLLTLARKVRGFNRVGGSSAQLRISEILKAGASTRSTESLSRR